MAERFPDTDAQSRRQNANEAAVVDGAKWRRYVALREYVPLYRPKFCASGALHIQEGANHPGGTPDLAQGPIPEKNRFSLSA